MIKKILFMTVMAAMGAGCATTHTNEVASNENAITNREPASDCQNGKDWTCKNARSNDQAAQYMLDGNGNFYRYMRTGQTCQITSGVTDFKISGHPDDAAYAYYQSKGALWVVYNQGAGGGNCPPVQKTNIMADVDSWKIVSNPNTTVVNAALNKQGRFVAWGPSKVIYTDDSIRDFEMNSCYKTAGKSFNSYALFTLDYSNNITKVKVTGDGVFSKDGSKPESTSFTSISDFKKARNVCN